MYIPRPFTSSTEVISMRPPSQMMAITVVTVRPGIARKRNRSVASEKAARFDITSVEDVKGRGMYIEVLAKEVKPSG